MAFDEGFNFRASLSYVTDPADTQFVDDVAGSYPTTANGATFGWVSGFISGKGRDRNSGVDPRLAGIQFEPNAAGQGAIFRVDLPNSGDYEIRLALGDAGAGQTGQFIEVFDDATSKFSLGTLTTASGEFADATGTLYTTAAWPGSNSAVTHSFASTICRFVLGGSGGGGINATIAHFSLVEVGSTPVTVTLTAAGVPWTGRTASLNERQAVALSPAGVAWTGRSVSLAEGLSVALTAAGVPWTGREITTNAQDIVDLTIAAATWSGLSVQANEIVGLQSGAVAWTGLDVTVIGSEVIALTAQGVTWTGLNVTVRVSGGAIGRILRQTMAYPGAILRTVNRTIWNVRDG